MKRILVLLVVLFSIGFSKDLTELGYEAYVKGDYQKAAQLYQKACRLRCYKGRYLYYFALLRSLEILLSCFCEA